MHLNAAKSGNAKPPISNNIEVKQHGKRQRTNVQSLPLRRLASSLQTENNDEDATVHSLAFFPHLGLMHHAATGRVESTVLQVLDSSTDLTGKSERLEPPGPLALNEPWSNVNSNKTASSAHSLPKKYKGVSEIPRNGKYECRVYLGRVTDPSDPQKRKVVNHYVGRYESPKQAAYCHDLAAVKHGVSDPSRLNFPGLFSVAGVEAQESS